MLVEKICFFKNGPYTNDEYRYQTLSQESTRLTRLS